MARTTRKCLQWWLTMGNEQTHSTEMMVPWFMPVVNHTWDDNKLKWPNCESFFCSVNNTPKLNQSFQNANVFKQCLGCVNLFYVIMGREARQGYETIGEGQQQWPHRLLLDHPVLRAYSEWAEHGRTILPTWMIEWCPSKKVGFAKKTIMTKAGWFGWHPHSGIFRVPKPPPWTYPSVRT